MGPTYIGRSYAVAAEELYLAQRALWRNALDAALIVEQWHLTKPLVHEVSSDGLHFHALLHRQPPKVQSNKGRDRFGGTPINSAIASAVKAEQQDKKAEEAEGVDEIAITTIQLGEAGRGADCRCASVPGASLVTGSGVTANDGWYQFSGPSLVYLLKILVNGLLEDSHDRKYVENRKEAAVRRHKAWHDFDASRRTLSSIENDAQFPSLGLPLVERL